MRDGTAPPENGGQTYSPSAHPGCLAPHAWLPDGRSLYDLFGEGFSLVVAEGADEEQVMIAERDADAAGTPFTIVRAHGVAIRTLYKADFTLVRPDQHVAWRGSKWDPFALRRATGRSEAAAMATA